MEGWVKREAHRDSRSMNAPNEEEEAAEEEEAEEGEAEAAKAAECSAINRAATSG